MLVRFSGQPEGEIYTETFPEVFVINGKEYGGSRNREKNKILIPCNEMPDVDYGDTIVQRTGKIEKTLKITDFDYEEEGTMKIGTNLPHLLTLMFVNEKAEQYRTTPNSTTINISSLNSDNVQIGNNNVQIHNATIKEIVDHVSRSDDDEAKSKLKSLLENPTVSSLIGAGATALLTMLG